MRIVPYEGQTQNIGELKRFACLACRGDVLVEVDHDDELTPDCVAELVAAFAEPQVDFAYSNCCEINEGKPWRYDEKYGWWYRPFAWDGQPQWECVAFDPSPASFSKIRFAPNHVLVCAPISTGGSAATIRHGRSSTIRTSSAGRSFTGE